MSGYRHIARPVRSARVLVGRRRSGASDHLLAVFLSFIAGAANAGGFFALGQYASHMTGYLSQIADNLILGEFAIVGVAALAICAFVAGAAFSTVLITWARLRDPRGQYAVPLAIQGIFLICFSWGGLLTGPLGRLFSLACLCVIMGMQNATITKISGARIRTTHATGMITDIGIELGRSLYRLFRPSAPGRTDHGKLRILLSLVGAFVIGGLVGAIGYSVAGFRFSLPLGLSLLLLSAPGLISKSRRVRGAG